jgi:hypothetical protein
VTIHPQGVTVDRVLESEGRTAERLEAGRGDLGARD